MLSSMWRTVIEVCRKRMGPQSGSPARPSKPWVAGNLRVTVDDAERARAGPPVSVDPDETDALELQNVPRFRLPERRLAGPRGVVSFDVEQVDGDRSLQPDPLESRELLVLAAGERSPDRLAGRRDRRRQPDVEQVLQAHLRTGPGGEVAVR